MPAQQASARQMTPTPSPSTPSRPDGIAAGARGLVQMLSAMYGARFVDTYRGTDPETLVAVWAHELRGYTAAELQRGLGACRTLKFPPTLPEFLMLCRPPLEPEAAFWEAQEQLRRREADADEWSNPAIFWAASSMAFDLRGGTYASLRVRWGVALQQAVRDLESGRVSAEIPKRPKALPPPVHKPAPMPANFRDRMAEIVGRMTGGANPSQEGSPADATA